MDFFGILNQAVGANMAGQRVLADLDEKKADIAYKQEQVVNAKQKNAEGERSAANDRALGDWIRSDSELKQGGSDTAADMAQQFARASKASAERGDFDGAKKMADLALGQINVAGKEQLQQERQEADATNELSVAAQNALEAPTPENHKIVVQKAIAAGISPAAIPLPGSTEYASFANQAALGAMKGTKRLEFMEKQREFEARSKERKELEAERNKDRDEARKDRAVAREQTAALAQQGLDIRKELAAGTVAARVAKEAAAANGGLDSEGYTLKPSATSERQATMVVNAANEAGAALTRMSKMDLGTRIGVFAHLEDPKTILKSLNTTGTNKLSNEQVQMMQANVQMLGLEVAQAMAAPYKPNKEQISEARRVVEPINGDTEFTALYRMALTADIMKTRLEAVPKLRSLDKARTTAETAFDKFPTAAEVYEAAKAKGIKLKLRKPKSTFMDRLGNLGGGSSDPGFAPADPEPTPKARQDLLNLYPAKQ